MFIAPRKRIISEVLEVAIGCGDEDVAAACRRLLWAHTLGWRRHADKADKALVWAFAEALHD